MWRQIKEYQVAFLGLCLLLALVLTAIIVSGTVLQYKKYAGQEITVTGSADRIIASDLAVWEGSFNRRANSMNEGYTALKGDLQKITAFLKDAGVPEKAIHTSAVTTETLYSRDAHGNNTNNVEGFIMRQSVKVESKDIDLVERVADEALSLLGSGITLNSQAPQYYYTKLNDLKVKMLGEATRNAKARAHNMARSTGNRIGLMRSANMGVFQITSKNSTDVSDYGINDTESRDKKVTAVVNVSFAVD